MHEQVEEKMGEQVEEQVEEHVEEQVEEQVRKHVRKQVEEQIREQVQEQLVEQVEESKEGEQLVEQVEESKEGDMDGRCGFDLIKILMIELPRKKGLLGWLWSRKRLKWRRKMIKRRLAKTCEVRRLQGLREIGGRPAP